MKKVIIIGAGLSGIYAATLLQKKYDVIILEARDRIGGRILNVNGFDMGPSWIWSHQKNILKLIYENNLELYTQYTQGDALYDTSQKVERFKPPPSAPAARIKGGISALTEALERKLILDTIKLRSPVIKVEKQEEEILVTTKEASYKASILINTLPPHLAINSIQYSPSLPTDVVQKLDSIPTWMGHASKCTIEFETPFWREDGLSGFCFSPIGPLGEIHDACTDKKAALFGFFHTQALDKSKAAVKEQMIRLFAEKAQLIKNIYITHWGEEQYTSLKIDDEPLRTHPNYGHHCRAYGERLIFAGTEAAFQEGGYLEGSIISVNTIIESL